MLATEIHGIAELLRTEPGKIGMAALILDIIAVRVATLEVMQSANASPVASTVVVQWGNADQAAWDSLTPHGGSR